jgi:hypothetical protein
MTTASSTVKNAHAPRDWAPRSNAAASSPTRAAAAEVECAPMGVVDAGSGVEVVVVVVVVVVPGPASLGEAARQARLGWCGRGLAAAAAARRRTTAARGAGADPDRRGVGTCRVPGRKQAWVECMVVWQCEPRACARAVPGK